MPFKTTLVEADMKTLREQITGRCVHFKQSIHEGMSDKNVKCKAGVSYYELCKVEELGHFGCGLRHPCCGREAGTDNNGETVERCDSYKAISEQEIQAELDQHEHIIDCLKRNVSSCCEASINESKVIREGQHKGHGPRFCSKCKRCVYMV